MGLEQSEVIDFISMGKTTGQVNLTIVDALDWMDENSHLILLQDKVNAYLRFIENGELDLKYPKAVGRRRSINVVAQFEPTEAGFRLIQRIRDLIIDAGFNFQFTLRPDLAILDES